MPEGHVIHRLANQFEEAFAGESVWVRSPQGRFASAAAMLDGTVLAEAEAYGKHLFLRFDVAEPRDVHIHLGLIGKLRFVDAGQADSPETVRLRIEDETRAAELRGPQTCALVTSAEREETIAGLGADPLRADADPEVAWARLHRSGKAVASLLLDQRITAGVGNIYRAEVLFRQGIDPATPGRQVSRAEWDRIWADLVALMADGLACGRIDTVRPEHSPEAQGRPPRVDPHGGEVYVYRRAGQPCLICGTPVRERVLESRRIFWCPTCQR